MVIATRYAVAVLNREAPWDQWPVADYLAENYRRLHDADIAVIDHHSAYYRRLEPDSIGESLEFGAGPNLYPLMLASGASRRIHAVERSAANVAYLRGQLTDGPDETWRPFWDRCRAQNPTLPATLRDALAKVHPAQGDAREATPDRYGLASMNFVAESATEDATEFAALCLAFIRSVRPGGHLVASFMENMGRYRIAGGRDWPGYPVDADSVRAVFAPHTEALAVDRVDADPDLPDWGYTGMVLLTARRST